MLYTRQGDSGTSGLFGTKERFPKDSPIYEALGTLDELNSLLGVCFAMARREGLEIPFSIPPLIRAVQQHLFVIQAELAGTEKHIMQNQIDELEDMINRLEEKAGNPHSFVIPGATELAGFLDYARAVSRRAERAVIAARETRSLSDTTYAYLNRLSSLLYALARYAATSAGEKEKAPAY